MTTTTASQDAWSAIEYRVNAGEWQLGKTLPRWAVEDRDMLKIQKAHVRSFVRECGDAADGDRVSTRVVDADDE